MTGSLGVLVVDDDFYVAAITAQYVTGAPGFHLAAVAHDAATASALVGRGGVDLILLDQHLPDEDGLALVRRLREQGRDVDVIMVSADSRSSVVRDALRLGVPHYIVKPFTAGELQRKLAAYARQREALEHDRLGQEDIDRVLGDLGATPPAPRLPKGLSGPTVRLVERVVYEAAAPLSAQEVSEFASISRSTAQRYLTFLERTRRLRLSLRYGTTGRPEHRYSRA